MISLNSVSDWMFDRVIQVDAAAPGLAGVLFRCSNEHRQVVAAYLSLQRPHRAFLDDAALGGFLMNARHNAILRAAFGTIPEGLRGALRRAGSRTHPRRFYPYLHRLLSSDSRAQTTALVPLMEKVTPSSLATARVLPADLRTPTLVSILGSADRARDVTRLVTLLSEAGVDRGAMCRALKSVTSMNDVIEFAGRWSFRAKLPSHPVPATELYTPIEHACDLKSVALKYRNCLRNLLANCLDGRAAFAVVRDGDQEAIVHLIRHRAEWTLHEICGPDNRLPNPAVEKIAAQYLERNGIERRRRSRSADSKWEPLRRLAGRDAHQMEMEEVMLG